VSYGAGSLTISARRAGSRTVLDRVHYDGLARCSRAFGQGEAALVVLSQLGPGVVRGDELSTTGTVQADAHLIVTSQTATRLLGGARIAQARSSWSLADAAVLEIVGEPLIAGSGAHYDATLTIDLGSGSLVILSEIAHVARDAHIRLRTVIRHADREIHYDAVDPSAAAPDAVGTLTIAGLAGSERIAAVVSALDAAADTQSTVRIGVGALTTGVFVRIAGDAIWPVRAALDVLRRTVWTALRAADSMSHRMQSDGLIEPGPVTLFPAPSPLRSF